MYEIQAVSGHELADVTLAMRAADKLNEQYPGHLWCVHLDDEERGGMMVIRNLAVSFAYGYRLKLSRVYADPDLKCVMRAGGEILERAGMKRGWWNGQDAVRVEGMPNQFLIAMENRGG